MSKTALKIINIYNIKELNSVNKYNILYLTRVSIDLGYLPTVFFT